MRKNPIFLFLMASMAATAAHAGPMRPVGGPAPVHISAQPSSLGTPKDPRNTMLPRVPGQIFRPSGINLPEVRCDFCGYQGGVGQQPD
jgi:hypothetical protein